MTLNIQPLKWPAVIWISVEWTTFVWIIQVNPYRLYVRTMMSKILCKTLNFTYMCFI